MTFVHDHLSVAPDDLVHVAQPEETPTSRMDDLFRSRTNRTSKRTPSYAAAHLVRGAGFEPSPHRITVCDATDYTNP